VTGARTEYAPMDSSRRCTCSSRTSRTAPRPARSCRSTAGPCRRARRQLDRDAVHHLNPARLNDAMSRFGSTDAPPVSDRESMLDVLQGFIHELRAAGLPVSMTENLDAMRAVEHVDIAERDTFKAALGATLVKHHHHWR